MLRVGSSIVESEQGQFDLRVARISMDLASFGSKGLAQEVNIS